MLLVVARLGAGGTVVGDRDVRVALGHDVLVDRVGREVELGHGDREHEGLGVGDERRAGGQVDLAGRDLRALLEALDGDDEALRDVDGLDVDRDGRVLGLWIVPG